jgi:prepilin-type N-terminal cleavage/methylation domain-containing protein
MTRRRTNRGFTLIELMVVVAILAVLSTVLFSLTGSSVGGVNPEGVANNLTIELNFARMRAVSTRAYHQIEVQPAQMILWEAWDTANNKPLLGLKLPAGPNQGWKQVHQISVPTSAISIWNAQAAIDTSGGVAVAPNAALDFFITYKPDGSSSGGTVFVSDRGPYKQWRILVYRATGSAYARNGF